jgi:23S rRNA (cytidine1920-2'-O)/16S rRNA (cytidine1409-2'-O)-methyltransferase
MAPKERVDLLMVERGLAESRSQAQRLVMAGQVRVNGQLVHKPSKKIGVGDHLTIEHGPAFVSRGGEKLSAALAAFPIQLDGAICAIDVGSGLMHWKLRNDPRIILMEGTNARYLESLPEAVDLAVVDTSFISLAIILPVVTGWIADEGNLIALIKPQFEAGREHIGKGGVVRDPIIHREVVKSILDLGRNLDLWPSGLIRSPITGPKGNIEFLVWLSKRNHHHKLEDLLSGLFSDKSFL